MSLDLEAIKARSEAATAGPWGRTDKSVYWPRLGKTVDGIEDLTPANADFIAAARTDVPDLVAEVERLRGLIMDVERCGPTDDESLGLCPWCRVPLDSKYGDHQHRADCPAFTPDGQLK